MSQDTSTSTPEQQQIQVMLDEREMRTVYANAYRIHTAPEEIILDLGFNMPNPNAQPAQAGAQPAQHLLFKVTDRVILSYGNARRLTASLQQLMKRFEQQVNEAGTRR